MSPPGWKLEPAAAEYPACLRQLDKGSPPQLYGIGDRALVAGFEHEHAVTIVGSRRASAYGLSFAEQLAHDLARAGVCVVSGLALGIDAAAHRGALSAGGVTVAVLANGPEIAYPPRNRALYEQIRERGALVSEQPPGTVARKDFFRKRNRIMAGLGKVVVIVEAALPSGSLGTADDALELDRKVGAVPGRVGSRVAEGTNELLASGAYMIRGAGAVLDLLYGVGAGGPRHGRDGPALDGELSAVLELIEGGSATVDEVVAAAGLEPRAAAIGLAELELLGYVEAGPGGRFQRSRLVASGPGPLD